MSDEKVILHSEPETYRHLMTNNNRLVKGDVSSGEHARLLKLGEVKPHKHNSCSGVQYGQFLKKVSDAVASRERENRKR